MPLLWNMALILTDTLGTVCIPSVLMAYLSTGLPMYMYSSIK